MAANPVRAHLMGYELWRFAALSLSLPLCRSIQHFVSILVYSRRNYSVPSASLLERRLLFVREGHRLFYPPSKATLKILTAERSGSSPLYCEYFARLYITEAYPLAHLSRSFSFVQTELAAVSFCELGGRGGGAVRK